MYRKRINTIPPNLSKTNISIVCRRNDGYIIPSNSFSRYTFPPPPHTIIHEPIDNVNGAAHEMKRYYPSNGKEAINERRRQNHIRNLPYPLYIIVVYVVVSYDTAGFTNNTDWMYAISLALNGAPEAR
jgi:hypothetical protein